MVVPADYALRENKYLTRPAGIQVRMEAGKNSFFAPALGVIAAAGRY
jgi:hypothetical protein